PRPVPGPGPSGGPQRPDRRPIGAPGGVRASTDRRNGGTAMRMKAISALWLAALAAGCGSYEVRDTNAAVDRNPMCASRPDRPGEPVASDCERETSATWSSERRDSPPVDFRRKRDDD